jgi:hypothetical protein
MPSSSILFVLSYGCLLLVILLSKPIAAFHPAATPKISDSSLHLIGVETIGIALISAAAGAGSQAPKIQSLESELSDARKALDQSKSDMVLKIEHLEDKLFQMDQAYEVQSATFQKEYNQRKQEEVAKITDKLKTDFQYKLDIKLEKEKSKLLSKQLDQMPTLDQSGKLAEMRMRQQQLEDAKSKLQSALKTSEAEMERMRAGEKKKGGFWPF